MTNISKTIIFFGSGPVAAESLNFLAEHFSIESVITKARPNHHMHHAPVEDVAKKLNIPIKYANSKKEVDDIFLKKPFNSRLGIVVDYGVIISKEVIDYFNLGIINSHFSLLPQWRGADPITFSILSGQEKTGVSLMVIDEKLDTGKLITQKEIDIDTEETSISLTKKLINLSNNLLIEYIPRYFEGNVILFNQPNQEEATYSHKISKEDGLIKPTKSAQQIEREIRAFSGWPGSRILFNKKYIIIKKAHIDDSPTTKLDIFCSDKKYLIIDDVIAPSGKRMSATAFLNGYPA